jgi:hypothetical protein
MSDRDDASHSRDTRKISELVAALAHEHPAGRICFAEIIERLGDRTYGLLILTFALPMVVAGSIPGISTLFGVPLIFITAQLALGYERPRFPPYLLRRSVDARDFNNVIDRIVPVVVRVEKYLRPRFPALVTPLAERVMGAISMLMAVILSLPIVFANGPPSIAMSLFAVAILERDGLFAILGVIMSIVSVMVAGTVITVGVAGIYYAISYVFG